MKCEVLILKVCMIGLGSIGSRHLNNIQQVLNENDVMFQIDALRSNKKLQNIEIERVLKHQYYKIEDLPDDYDVIFIANPTALHYDTIYQVLNKTKHMFIEKPVFDNDLYDLHKLQFNPNSVYYVACPLRHKSIIQYVKEKVVPNENIVSCRIISSSYLPNWRKGIDYRQIYSAKESLGGGVTKDLIHEWDYAIYLFGKPKDIYNIKGHFSNLEIDSDDVSVYIAKYEKMLLEIHLDYIGQKEERVLQLFANDKRIDVDLIHDELNEYQNNSVIKKITFDKEDLYLNEMRYFFDCVAGRKKNINSIADAYATLKIALGDK